MTQPDISIIIPMYNTAEYIRGCLISVLKQNGIDRTEIIVIDDGSTDNGGDIVARYAGRVPNLRLVRQKNAGVSAARNLGIDLARGKYISFVDSDDQVGIQYSSIEPYFRHSRMNRYFNNLAYTLEFLDPDDGEFSYGFDADYFTKMLRLGDEMNADVVLGGKITVTDSHSSIKRHVYLKNHYYSTSEEDKDAALKNADARESANFALYRRDFLNRENLRFLTGMHLDEDMLFCQQAILRARGVAAAADVTYLYNRRGGTLSNFVHEIGLENAEKKYAIAHIQRYSMLLRELRKHPEYRSIYSHWLKVFSKYGDNERLDYFRDYFPPVQCYQCGKKNCAQCVFQEYLDNITAQNIAKFIPRGPER